MTDKYLEDGCGAPCKHGGDCTKHITIDGQLYHSASGLCHWTIDR